MAKWISTEIRLGLEVEVNRLFNQVQRSACKAVVQLRGKRAGQRGSMMAANHLEIQVVITQ